MPISITNIITALENKIAALDSSVSSQDMRHFYNAADLANITITQTYDSTGLLPTADSDYRGQIALVSNPTSAASGNALYICLDSGGGVAWNAWQTLDSGAAYAFQGDTKAYAFGGAGKAADAPAPTSPVASNNSIESWPFASDTNGTDVGDLPNPTKRNAGVSSATAGYDFTGAPNSPPDISGRDQIDKFVFASETASSIAPGSVAESGQFGAAPASNDVAGYNFQGSKWTVPTSTPTATTTTVLKLTYASDTSGSTDVGDMSPTPATTYAVGCSSPTEGKAYVVGGQPGQTSTGPLSRSILEIPFASETSVTTRSNLLINTLALRSSASGPTDGFVAGGFPGTPGNPQENIIEKFPFASDASVSDHGDLSLATRDAAGVSGETNGYSFGSGNAPASPQNAYNNTIQRWPYSSNTTATDVGDMTIGRYQSSGWQN